MRRMINSGASILIGTLFMMLLPVASLANPNTPKCRVPSGGISTPAVDQIIAEAAKTSCPPPPVNPKSKIVGKVDTRPVVTKAQLKKLQAARKAEIARRAAANKAAIAHYETCFATTGVNSRGCVEPQLIGAVPPLDVRVAGEAKPAPPPPEVIAYTAIAQLKLTAPKPMIGPSPDINPWKIAAVGYPMWLWAEGNLDPAPVSDTIYDVSVSLDAHLDKVVFDMGDHHSVTCTTLTRRWHRGIEPGAESPRCGYRYSRPSLPKGKYTITAHAYWSVTWNINGQTGTLPMYQSASTTLPVGELQVLVR